MSAPDFNLGRIEEALLDSWKIEGSVPLARWPFMAMGEATRREMARGPRRVVIPTMDELMAEDAEPIIASPLSWAAA